MERRFMFGLALPQRRTVRSALATATLVGSALLAVAGPAHATTVTNDPALVGLYGAQDPTNPQAVFRQSLAIIALKAAGRTPDPTAVTWLANQQCPDGSFMGFAVDKACTTQGFDSPESNSTSIAAIALRSAGQTAASDKAVEWLKTVQDASGGFEFQPGFGADANSTGLAISALLAAGRDPSTFNGHNAYAGLGSLQADCSRPATDVGAFLLFFAGNATADLYATAQALPAAARATYPVDFPGAAAWLDDVPPTDCAGAGVLGNGDAAAAAFWLTGRPNTDFGGSFDPVSSRAFAIMGLAASKVGETRARALFADMTSELSSAVVQAGADSPGRIALYILAGHALGEDTAFGSANLVDRLEETLNVAPTPTPSATPTPGATTTTPTQGGAALAQSASTTGSSAQTATLANSGARGDLGWLAGAAVLLVVAGGALLVVSGRRRSP
jgi:hypothetical protein